MGRNHKRVLEVLGHEVIVVDPIGGDWPDIALAPNADFCCVATPPNLLACNAKQAVERGMPTLVEKPMAASVVEAASLGALDGAPLTVGYVEYHNPAFTALREHLPRIGAIRHVSAQRLSPLPGRALGDVTHDLATHEIHNMIRLLGFPETSIVRATQNHHASIFTFAGATASIEASWLSATKVRKFRVVGDEGSLILDYRAQSLHLQSEGATYEIGVRQTESLAQMWREFLAGYTPCVTAADGLAVLEAIQQQE